MLLQSEARGHWTSAVFGGAFLVNIVFHASFPEEPGLGLPHPGSRQEAVCSSSEWWQKVRKTLFWALHQRVVLRDPEGNDLSLPGPLFLCKLFLALRISSLSARVGDSPRCQTTLGPGPGQVQHSVGGPLPQLCCCWCINMDYPTILCPFYPKYHRDRIAFTESVHLNCFHLCKSENLLASVAQLCRVLTALEFISLVTQTCSWGLWSSYFLSTVLGKSVLALAVGINWRRCPLSKSSKGKLTPGLGFVI